MAMANTDVFAAAAIWGTYLLMTAGLSAVFLGERTSGGAAVGMAPYPRPGRRMQTPRAKP